MSAYKEHYKRYMAGGFREKDIMDRCLSTSPDNSFAGHDCVRYTAYDSLKPGYKISCVWDKTLQRWIN